uniref:Terpene synthase N-terminal domain-containing protein n=1 Tax=Oryza nivara TaxID=4536 RepID=A0A0E0GZA7_ORYNI
MSSYCLSFLSHGPVETAAAAIRLGGRWPVAVQHVLRARPKRASFRRSRTVLRGYASIVGTLVTPSGDDEIIAAAGKEASGFEPSMWRDFFINYEPKPLQACRSEEWMVERAEKLKDDVRRLFETCDSTERRMQLVDAVQHLGTDHLFKEEIEYSLSEINASEFISSSLHDVALRSRLLRQHGFRVSLDVFNKFKGDDGRFVSGITDDPRGLLSLYNAAHLLTHDEPELEEAITFATQHLASLSSGTDLNPHLIDQINRALDVPLPRTFRRMESLFHMSEYRQEEGHIPILLELAKLDFNLLQHVHLRELKAISEWWKDLYGYMGLSYIRDRVVESYVWSYVVFYEEGSALARMIFTKIIVFIILMDDTYDSYATIQECRKLNEAIQRWDESATPFLPEYMKKFYRALLKTFKEFEIHVEDDGQNRIDHTKKASSVTSTVPLLSVSTAVDRGDALTKEAFEWAANETSAKTACAKITRFMNDIAAFKRGRKNRGDVASTVECYMNENKVTSEDAFTKIDSMIEDEWRTIN